VAIGALPVGPLDLAHLVEHCMEVRFNLAAAEVVDDANKQGKDCQIYTNL